jgi:hypothetical protein
VGLTRCKVGYVQAGIPGATSLNLYSSTNEGEGEFVFDSQGIVLF